MKQKKSYEIIMKRINYETEIIMKRINYETN